MKKLVRLLIPCLLTALLAGCGAPTPYRYYTLSPVPAPARAQPQNLSLALGPISLPGAIERQQIVLRTGPNQVSLSEHERWAAPLKENVARVMVANLAAMLGTSNVSMFPQASAEGANYRAVVDILRLDSEVGKLAELDALWVVSSNKTGKSQRGRTTVTEPAQDTGQGSSYAALVAAHSRALGQLSADIARVVQAMEDQQP